MLKLHNYANRAEGVSHGERLSGESRKGMRQSELLRKPRESDSKKLLRHHEMVSRRYQPKVTEYLEDRFGTAPVRDAYFVLGNTGLIGDWENVTGFIAKAQYPNQMNTLRPEWGSISNLRILLSSIGSTTPAASANGATVYNNFCVGMEAYACVEQDGYSAQFIYRPPIYDGPLALNATVNLYPAVEKPALIDLELLMKDGDDKAQAEQYALAA